MPTLSRSVIIGGVIPGATAGSVLVVGTGGILSQDNAGLFYNAADDTLTITGTVDAPRLVLRASTSQVGVVLDLQNSSGVTQSSIDGKGYGFLRPVTFVLASGGAATAGTNKTNVVIVERAGRIVKAFIAAKTGPTGAAFIVDINKNGTSIWNTTQANRLQVAAGGTSNTQTNFDTTAVAEGDQLTIDIDQIGSTVAGQDITVQLLLLCRNG